MAPPRSSRERLEGDGEIRLNSPIEIMRFTLTYRGPLTCQSRDSQRAEKHAIRKQLNVQLWDLWRSRGVLHREISAWAQHLKDVNETKKQSGEPFSRADALPVMKAWEEERSLSGDLKHFLQTLPRGEFLFAPLITRRLSLICELDILFLRAEERGALFSTNQFGDLDNRLKTLFDALTVPRQDNQLPPGVEPEKGREFPFLCLLEDDRLVTAMRVESERLLALNPETRNQVELVIRVTVKTEHLNYVNLDIVGTG